MHTLVIQTYENEKAFLRKAKELNVQLMSEKIRLERMAANAEAKLAANSTLKDKLSKLDSELEQSLEKEAMAELRAQELAREKKELQQSIAAKQEAEQAGACLLHTEEQEVLSFVCPHHLPRPVGRMSVLLATNSIM